MLDKAEKILAWIKFAGAAICTVIANALGGADTALKVVLIMTALDICAGVLKAVYNRVLNSQAAYRGAIKKIGIYLVIAISCKLDQYMNTDFIRTFTIGYYIANEGLSIIENLGACNVPLPNFIKTVLLQLKENSDNVEVTKSEQN